MSIFTKKPLKVPERKDADRCRFCFGSGFVNRSEMKMVPQIGTATEYYTDARGQRQSRNVPKYGSVSRWENVRRPCSACGGTGRARS